VRYLVKPNFRALGKRFGSTTQQVAAAITTADAASLAAALQSDDAATVEVAGRVVVIGPDDVIVTQVPAAGWTVAAQGSETVALEVTISAELRREGLAREFVRLVQDARKSDGMDVTDRIALRWSTGDRELATALHEHRAMIAGEVLALEFGPTPPGTAEPDPGAAEEAGVSRRHDSVELGVRFWLAGR
jgi:isoleucyl-tRNA synthetase